MGYSIGEDLSKNPAHDHIIAKGGKLAAREDHP